MYQEDFNKDGMEGNLLRIIEENRGIQKPGKGKRRKLTGGGSPWDKVANTWVPV